MWSCRVTDVGWKPISTCGLELQRKPPPARSVLRLPLSADAIAPLLAAAPPLLICICVPGILAFSAAAINEPFA